MTRPVVIYIPGLGDQSNWLMWPQAIALRRWGRYGFRTKIFRVGWSQDAALGPRYEQLLQVIRTYHEAGHTVSLVGTSAGASIAVRACAENPDVIHRVITICGKLDGPLPEQVKAVNPTFAESYEKFLRLRPRLLRQATDKILCFYSPGDIVVPVDEAIVENAQLSETPKLGHNLACLFVLLCRARRAAQFLHSQ